MPSLSRHPYREPKQTVQHLVTKTTLSPPIVLSHPTAPSRPTVPNHHHLKAHIHSSQSHHLTTGGFKKGNWLGAQMEHSPRICGASQARTILVVRPIPNRPKPNFFLTSRSTTISTWLRKCTKFSNNLSSRSNNSKISTQQVGSNTHQLAST